MEKYVCRVAMGAGRVEALADDPPGGSAAVDIKARYNSRITKQMEIILQWPRNIIFSSLASREAGGMVGDCAGLSRCVETVPTTLPRHKGYKHSVGTESHCDRIGNNDRMT